MVDRGVEIYNSLQKFFTGSRKKSRRGSTDRGEKKTGDNPNALLIVML